MNSLGVLYAKNGPAGQGLRTLPQSARVEELHAAILNMGNLLFTQGDWKGSLQYFNQAPSWTPRTTTSSSASRRRNQELQNYDDAKKNYDRLKGLIPAWRRSTPTWAAAARIRAREPRMSRPSAAR